MKFAWSNTNDYEEADVIIVSVPDESGQVYNSSQKKKLFLLTILVDYRKHKSISNN